MGRPTGLQQMEHGLTHTLGWGGHSLFMSLRIMSQDSQVTLWTLPCYCKVSDKNKYIININNKLFFINSFFFQLALIEQWPISASISQSQLSRHVKYSSSLYIWKQ